MQPLIRVPDPQNPPFTALNEARGFYPFDPIKLNWHATADPKDRAAPLANFGLGLKYTIKENQEHPLPVLVPASGTLSFLARESRTLVLEVDARALERLHVGGLDVKAARLLISFDAGQEDDLHAHLTALYTKGTLTRHWIEDQDLRVQKDAFTVVELPSATTEDQRRKQHLEPWWNGISAVPWSIKHVDQNTVLMELKKNESILIHAEVRGHASAPWHQEQGPDKWWRCNVGYFLGALGVAGDPHANDKIYRALSGDCRDLVSSSGDIPEKFEDVVVLYKGSRNSVVLQPAGPGTGSPIIPSALFSFSTADDIAIFAPTLEDTPLELECQQPTLNCWQMQQVKDQMTLRTGPKKKRNWYNKNNANRVYVPPFSSGLAAGVILASDYGKHAQANIKGKKKIPADRSKFFDAVDRVYDYSLVDPFVRRDVGDGLTDWERNFNINERDALRPRHLPWRTRGGQLRRLYPLRLQFSWSGKSFIAVQDEVDCIRQEFVFHMPWTTGEDGKLYYQANLKWNKFKAGSHRIGTRDVLRNKPGEETVPALGSTGRIVVPERAHIRPFPKSEYKSLAQKSERGSLPRFFRHTYLPPMWEESLEKIKKRAAEHTDHVSQVLDRLDQSQPTPPLDPNLYRCEVLQLVTQRIHELVRGAEHVSNPDNWPTAQGILEIQLTGFLYRDITALEWFTRLSPFDLTISSSWRPPEHNETVPKGIANSDHQRGDGMDLKPKGSGPASRNPLAMLCLHHAAQELVETKKIRVCYLELGGTNYLTNWPDPDLTIKEDVPIYEVKRANDKVGYSFNSTGYLPEGLGRMSQNLPKAFRSRLNKVKVNQLSLSWPDPPPTYLEMYIFALSNASHVHFTWKS